MKKNEKIVLIVAVALVVVALALYFIQFGDGTFSEDKAEWGYFGMYFSGFITPLLLVIVIILIFSIMKDVRDISSESSRNERKFQRQFSKQTRYMEPSADVVYYLQLRDDRLYAIIENLGNQPAYNISMEFDFEEEIDARISNNLLPLAEISYLAPEQKSGAVCGILDETTGGYAIAEHTVLMKYKPSEKSRRIIRKEFVIDKNILNTLLPETSVEESIQTLTENIRDLEHKITENESKTEDANSNKTSTRKKKPPKKEKAKSSPSESKKDKITSPTDEENVEEVAVGGLTVEPNSEQNEKEELQKETQEKTVLKRDTFDNPFLDDF